jgi:hypothetical protein
MAKKQLKLRHKALVKVVYPKAYCTKGDLDDLFHVYDRPDGRELSLALSAWGAWNKAYAKFSKAQKAKALKVS